MTRRDDSSVENLDIVYKKLKKTRIRCSFMTKYTWYMFRKYRCSKIVTCVAFHTIDCSNAGVSDLTRRALMISRPDGAGARDECQNAVQRFNLLASHKTKHFHVEQNLAYNLSLHSCTKR